MAGQEMRGVAFLRASRSADKSMYRSCAKVGTCRSYRKMSHTIARLAGMRGKSVRDMAILREKGRGLLAGLPGAELCRIAAKVTGTRMLLSIAQAEGVAKSDFVAAAMSPGLDEIAPALHRWRWAIR